MCLGVGKAGFNYIFFFANHSSLFSHTYAIMGSSHSNQELIVKKLLLCMCLGLGLGVRCLRAQECLCHGVHAKVRVHFLGNEFSPFTMGLRD